MKKRKTLAAGAFSGAGVCTLVIACSSSTPAPSNPTLDASTVDSASNPADTTPVQGPPFAACTPLQPGSFEYNGSSAYPVPTTTGCATAGGPLAGIDDAHCVGVPPQTVNPASCIVGEGMEDASVAIDAGSTTDAGSGDAGACVEQGGACAQTSDCCTTGQSLGATCVVTPGTSVGTCTLPCQENGTDGEYGYTHFNTDGDDDDCKYHVSYTASPICENNGTYFVVTASYLAQSGADGGPAPLKNASTFAEICLSATHPAPASDARPPSGVQEVVEGPPGTYTIGPVQFDAPGNWTVRFHFNEYCCDVADDSPHGHAAFFVSVP